MRAVRRFRSALVVGPWLALGLLLGTIASVALAQTAPDGDGAVGQSACSYGWHWDFFVQECVRDPTPTPTPQPTPTAL